MGNMKSKKKLFQALSAFDAPHFYDIEKLGLTHKYIGNETYGKKSMIYVEWDTKDQRLWGEKYLTECGFTVHKDYSIGGKRSEVQVSYFKGENWDE